MVEVEGTGFGGARLAGAGGRPEAVYGGGGGCLVGCDCGWFGLAGGGRGGGGLRTVSLFVIYCWLLTVVTVGWDAKVGGL